MERLFLPVKRVWNYVETYYGFPGQVFFCLMVILLVLGVLYFLSNRGA